MANPATTDFSRGRKREHGFTVTEILVATAIFAIIFVAALMIYDRSQRVFKQGVESGDLQQNTRIAFDRIVSDLRMAGFDYDRDGFPTSANQAQQPDEQIEYAGPSAITIRANFNFEDRPSQGGRVFALEPPTDTASQFPVVTTGNNEIVTYVLVSNTASANTDTLTFFADVTDGAAEKRQTYPGGSPEDTISIANVDLCTGGCNDPPYTLMRVTLDAAGTPIRIPIATNIRDMQFEYFQDTAGGTLLAVTDPGGGQYNPANPAASQTPRAVRSRIRAINVRLTGMNENPDLAYTDPNETIAGAARFRKYELSTLIVPRNIGKRGLVEQQDKPPGAPMLTSVCFGACGVVTMNWTAPAFNPAFGSVESYSVLWDTDVLGSINPQPVEAINIGLATSYSLSGLDPSSEYRFTVFAVNSYGETPADQFVTGFPKNSTSCGPPTGLTATLATPLENRIDLLWVPPIENVSGQDTIICKTPGGATTTLPPPNIPNPEEFQGYEVWRDIVPNFNPAAPTAETTNVGLASGTSIGYSDVTAANCKDYYYRLRVVENCVTDIPNENISPAVPRSVFEPVVASPGVHGRAESAVVPEAPTNLTVLPVSSCTAGTCNVTLEWPMVTRNVNGDLVSIALYEFTVLQNGVAYGGPFSVGLSSGLSLAGGIARYTHTGIPELDGSSVPYEYTYEVRAEQCALTGDPSPPAKFPLCTFAGGATPVVTIADIGGSGTAADPWEILDSGGIGFGVTLTANAADLALVTAKAYDVATNGLFADMGSQAGPVAAFTFPGGSQSEDIYRIDLRLTDVGSCETTLSFYVKSTQITCPFTVPVTLAVETPDTELSFRIGNTLNFNVQLSRVEFDWDETKTLYKSSGGGCPCYSDFSNVRYPSGAGTIGSSLTGSTGTSGTVISIVPGSASQLPANDLGSYKIIPVFNAPGGASAGGLTTGALTRVKIYYRVVGIDATTDPERECTVYP